MNDKNVRLSEIIAPFFHKTFLSKKPNQIDSGGRASTKTSKNALKVVYHILNEKDCSAIVLRRHTNKLRRSVYSEIKKAFSRLGLSENIHYKSTVSPFEITYLGNGNKIYFSGVENYESLKGFIDESRPIKIVWIEELTEFFDKSLEDGEELISNIEATFSRGNHDWFFILYSFNPPRNPNHAIMRWTAKMRKRDDVIYTHTTYLEVNPEWLGTSFLQQAERLKEYDEELYRHTYLGECVGTRGRIYTIKEEYTKEVESYYDFYTMAIDIGESKSATTFCLVGFRYENLKLKAHLLEEFHHRNHDLREVDQLDFEGYAIMFIDFYNKCVEKYGRHPLQIRIDHDVMFKKALKVQFTKNKLNYSLVRLAIKNKINDRINAFKIMLASGLFHFSKNCPITIQAFKDALWNEKKADKGIDERLDDLTTNIDSLDCVEYAVEPYFNKIIDSRMWKGVE